MWLYLRKDKLKGEAKKLKPLKYGPFDIIEKVNKNYFKLIFPPYMRIILVVNVEDLRLFEPLMLDEHEGH